VLTKDAATALALVDAAFARGQDLAQLAHAFLGHLRDLVVARAVAEPSSLAALVDASPSELEALVKAAQSVPAGVPELLFERFAKVAEETAKSAVPRYVLEVGLIALTRVEPLEPIGALLAKLEALESRVEKGGGGNGGGTRPVAAPTTNAPVAVAAPPVPQKRAAPQNFTQLIEALLEVDGLLGPLAHTRLLAQDDVHLSLGLEKEFHADRLREQLPRLRAALKKVTGKDLAVEIIVGPPEQVAATENLVEVEDRKVDEDRERRRREALEHPMRKALDDRFGGTWRDPIVDDVEKNR
jgi:DNA polymerase III gamma/tau subunit